MLEDLIKHMNTEIDKLVGKHTIELLRLTEMSLREDYNDFELVEWFDKTKKAGYELKFVKSYKNTDWLSLYKGEELIAGYEYDIRVNKNEIKILSIPIK